MMGQNRIRHQDHLPVRRDDGTHVVEFMTAEGEVLTILDHRG